MPVRPQQQLHKPTNDTPSKKGGVLDRIAPVKKTTIGRLKFSCYGTPKTGKTRFACTFPKPLLLIGAEDGTASVQGVKGVDFIQLNRTEETYELIDGPLAGGEYRTVVLDTATRWREMRIVELFAAMRMDVPERKPFLYADKVWKGVWTQCAQDLRNVFTRLLDLPRVTDINVVIIAQESNLYKEDQGGETEMFRPIIASAIGKSAAEFLNAECDYVAQMLIREKTVEVEKSVGSLKSTVKQVVGAEYVMRVGPDPIYKTGFRRSLDIKEPLPDFIVDPSYAAIVKLINGEQL